MRNEKGQFTKGNKAGGRKKGSRNKTTEKVRETFLHFIYDNLDSLQNDFDQLEPKDRFKILLDMARFIIPTLRAVEFGNVLDEMNEKDFDVLINRLKEENNTSRSIYTPEELKSLSTIIN